MISRLLVSTRAFLFRALARNLVEEEDLVQVLPKSLRVADGVEVDGQVAVLFFRRVVVRRAEEVDVDDVRDLLFESVVLLLLTSGEDGERRKIFAKNPADALFHPIRLAEDDDGERAGGSVAVRLGERGDVPIQGSDFRESCGLEEGGTSEHVVQDEERARWLDLSLRKVGYALPGVRHKPIVVRLHEETRLVSFACFAGALTNLKKSFSCCRNCSNPSRSFRLWR